MGVTLGFYIALRFLKVLLAMAAGLAFLIVTVDFIEQIRRTSDIDNVSLLDLYTISLLRAPVFVERIFPFASLFAAMTTLTQLNNKMELVVARAAGVSAWQFLLPIAITAALVGVFVSTTYNPMAIRALHYSNDLSAAILERRNAVAATARNPSWLKQEDAGGGQTIIRASLVRNEGKLLDQVKFIRMDESGRIIERFDALHAVFDDDKWLLLDAIRKDELGRTEKLAAHLIPSNLTEGELIGAGIPPEEVPFWKLTDVAAQVEKSGTNSLPYLVHYHNLTALPLFLVAMTLVAATVCLRFVRFGQVARMILGGIIFGFVLYTASSLVLSLGNNGVIPPAIAAWAPGLVAILFGMSMLLHQEDG